MENRDWLKISSGVSVYQPAKPPNMCIWSFMKATKTQNWRSCSTEVRFLLPWCEPEGVDHVDVVK
jgi:hypothetical protein